MTKKGEWQSGAMKIALREARPVDYGFARQLYRATMLDRIEAAFGWDEYRQDMSFARQFILKEVRIITLGGKDVGWIQNSHRGCGAEFFAVLRRAGMARPRHRYEVLKRLMTDAKRRGNVIALSVMKGSPAIRLYQRHGFHPTHADAYKIYLRQAVKPPRRGIGPSMGMRRG